MLLVDKYIRYLTDIYFISILNILYLEDLTDIYFVSILNITMQYENSDKFLLFLFSPCK